MCDVRHTYLLPVVTCCKLSPMRYHVRKMSIGLEALASADTSKYDAEAWINDLCWSNGWELVSVSVITTSVVTFVAVFKEEEK